MSKIINFVRRHKKICIEIAACKFVEGILILLAAKILVLLVNSPSLKCFGEIFFVWTARILISNVSAKKFLALSVKVQTSTRKSLHEEIFQRELSSGELLTIIFDTVKTLDEFFMKVAPNIAATIILLPLFLICAAATDLLTAAILFVTLPIAPFLLYLIGKVTAEKNLRALSALEKLNGEFREILSAVTTLKIFGRINFAAEKLKATSEKSSAATLEVLKFAFVSSFALELITTLSIALVAVTLGLRLVAGSVEFDAALFLLLIAPEFFLPIRKLGVAFHVAVSTKSAYERLQKFLSRPAEKVGTVEKILMPPEIFVDDVTFTYPKKFRPTLQNVNLKFPAGKVTALIGESGCGKSTLLKLLAGLNVPTNGEIYLNDLPTSKMQRESFLSKISYMPQAPHLFDGTLAENFSMFNQLDTSKLHELLTALNLPLNLQSTQKLSRGQLQRLGIIRAVLKDVPILILDEPTAGLDAENELRVLNLLKKFSLRKTIIIATHRQAVIDFADLTLNL
ncbi:MAG: ATP-binding cassette domain-containing protein [Selenomonadaceae bacterium]|nr:ATP-binding cassette domain-containing protein [Selenomonadaceae bacterium]